MIYAFKGGKHRKFFKRLPRVLWDWKNAPEKNMCLKFMNLVADTNFFLFGNSKALKLSPKSAVLHPLKSRHISLQLTRENISTQNRILYNGRI